MKILSVAQFETEKAFQLAADKAVKFHKNFESYGSIIYEPNVQVVYVQLNCLETHLIVLFCKQLNESFEYFINIYDLQTIQFAQNPKSQVK